MTKFELITELLGTANLLLHTNMTTCSTSAAKSKFDAILAQYEALDGQPTSPNSPSDLEHYHYIVDSLHQLGFELYKEENAENIQNASTENTKKMKIVLDDIAKNLPLSAELAAYFHTIENIAEDDYMIFLDEPQESEVLVYAVA